MFLVLAALLVTLGVARGGHELPVYPSYYPHEIAIETMPPERATDLLRDATYPVTPLHGDYLYHVDRAEAEKMRLLSAPAASPPRDLIVKASGALADLVRPEWLAKGSDWDAAVEEIDAAELMAASTTSLNGWLGPPWVKGGWFHAERMLADATSDAEARHRIEAMSQRLEAGDYRDTVERVNLERELVATLTGGCRKQRVARGRENM